MLPGVEEVGLLWSLKSLELLVEDVGGKLKGCIWERSRGVSSWIRFGEVSLCCLLDGVEACCREIDRRRWVLGWEEGGRKYGLEFCSNDAGRFLLCSVRDLETKIFSIIFLEGKGLSGGWNTLAKKLRGLGVVLVGGLKETRVLEVSLREKRGSKVPSREKRVETKTYVDVVKSKPGRIGDSVWLELGEREV